MNKQQRILAAVFLALALLTWFVKKTLWVLEGSVYPLALYALAIASLVIAVMIVMRARHRWRATAFVVLGLAIGQLWLLQSWFTRLTWAIGGFAP